MARKDSHNLPWRVWVQLFVQFHHMQVHQSRAHMVHMAHSHHCTCRHYSCRWIQHNRRYLERSRRCMGCRHCMECSHC